MRPFTILGLSLAALAAACSDESGTTAPSPIPDLSEQSSRPSSGEDRGTGAVYILSNDASANAILVFQRGKDGHLGTPTAVSTGGRGTGAGLGNQGAIALDPKGRRLYGVNAGSDEISAFTVDNGSLQLIQHIGSGGNQPISIALHDDLLYVLNDGATANITGFRVRRDGSLVPLPGSTRARSAPAGAVDGGQIGFSPDGEALLVTEKAANLLVSYRLLPGGQTGDPIVVQSSGATPFGFGFAPKGSAVVAEAGGGVPNGSSVSSYDVNRQARVRLVSRSVSAGQTAACWIAVTSDGRFAYAANTGSGTISGLNVSRSGAIRLLSDNGVTGTTGAGSAPADLGFSRGDRFLYVRNGGNRTVSIFRTGEAGSLTLVDTFTGLPAGTTGLVAR